MTKDQVFNTNQNSRVKPSEVTAYSGSKFIGATFLYMTIALLVTFGVVGIMGALFRFALYDGSEESAATFVSLFLVALLLYIPVLIWVHIAARRNGRTVGPAFFTYSIVMGAVIAPICVIFDFWTIVIALGSTCLAFAVMALIAWNSKKNMSNLAVIGSGLIIGALILSLFNFILSIFMGGFNALYLAVSFMFFIAIILLTIFDLNNVKRIAMEGNGSKNIALLCALNLYVDFIYIFIRMLRIIAVLFLNRR